MRIQYLRRWAGCGLLAWLIAIPAFATGLRVKSATIEANPDRLVVDMTNDGSATVTAWGIDIIVMKNSAEVSHTAYSEDLLNTVLNDRMGKRASQPVVGSWPGAIAPGESYEKILPLALPAVKPGDLAATVQVTIAGVIYADGIVDTVDPVGARDMRRFEDYRAVSARVETEAGNIFAKYAGDADTIRRFEEIRQAIISEMNQAAKGSGATAEYSSSEFQTLLRNLDGFQKSAKAQQLLEQYTMDLAERRKLRTELMAKMKD